MPTGNSRLRKPYDLKLAYRHTPKQRADDRKRVRRAAKRSDKRRRAEYREAVAAAKRFRIPNADLLALAAACRPPAAWLDTQEEKPF